MKALQSSSVYKNSKRTLLAAMVLLSASSLWAAGLSTPRTIDAVLLSKNKDEVWLSLTVDRPWSEAASFQDALNEKLSAYMEFVASGQLVSRVPQAKGLPVRVIVYCAFEPTGEGLRLIDSYKPQFRARGILLQWMVSKSASTAP